MKCNKEWEQIKTEYKEITIPEHGIAQVEEAMERATYHRDRRRKFNNVCVIVAALLCIVLLPKSLQGGLASNFSAKSESAIEETVLTQNDSFNCEGNEMTGSAFSDGIVVEEESDTEMISDIIDSVKMDTFASISSKERENSLGLVIEIEKEESILSVYLSKEQIKEINQEIFYQMKSIEEQSTFLGISSEQAYYINEDGLLVVVWEEKNLEFIIPQSIIFIENLTIP